MTPRSSLCLASSCSSLGLPSCVFAHRTEMPIIEFYKLPSSASSCSRQPSQRQHVIEVSQADSWTLVKRVVCCFALLMTTSRILFLCTGNYYRSRYAEELFNYHAKNAGLDWRAFSRGLAERGSPDNVGPMSPFALDALRAAQSCASDGVGTHPVFRRCAHVPGRAKANVMRFELSQAMSPGGFGRASDFLLILLLSTTMAVIGAPALASDVGDDQTAVQQQPPSAENRRSEEKHQAKQNDGPEPSAPLTAPSLCEAIAMAATTNDLPVDFFNRLIWQESRFKPDTMPDLDVFAIGLAAGGRFRRKRGPMYGL